MNLPEIYHIAETVERMQAQERAKRHREPERWWLYYDALAATCLAEWIVAAATRKATQ